MAAGDITTQPKQGRQAGPMSSLCILLCLWSNWFSAQAFNQLTFDQMIELVPIQNVVEWMTKYLRAARMPALQCFVNLERRDQTCRWYDIMFETFFTYFEKVKMFVWIILVEGLHHLMLCRGYKRLTEAMNQGQSYDVTDWIKFYKSILWPNSFSMTILI